MKLEYIKGFSAGEAQKLAVGDEQAHRMIYAPPNSPGKFKLVSTGEELEPDENGFIWLRKDLEYLYCEASDEA